MVNRMLENHWCRLLSGNLSVTLLVVGIPVAVVFAATQTLTTLTAGLVVLAIVHVSLIGLQVSRRGTWIPEKWLAVGFLFLPVIDVSRSVSCFSEGFWVHGLWAFGMALVASFITVFIVQHQWRKWREPKTVEVTVNKSLRDNHGDNYHIDDPTSMVY
ncbi:MAG: hypothetical protein KDA84_02565 [Planctomycetaceae bacterium]|nr:hypothetical protein [Planctomycetaceae bacterium]